jgi:hypothetical protein
MRMRHCRQRCVTRRLYLATGVLDVPTAKTAEDRHADPSEIAGLRGGHSGRRLTGVQPRCLLAPTVMRNLCLLSLAAVGCSVDIQVSTEPATIAFLSPDPGATFARDTLGDTGALVATVPISLDVGGDDIARVTVSIGDRDLGDVDEARYAAMTAQIRALGAASLTARALADDGTELATTTVDIQVAEPEVADCKGWLDLFKLDYTSGPTNPGVGTPITVKAPINGVAYRYTGSTEPRKTVYADCALVKSLAEGAAIMRAVDIVELVDMGIYNYRCIDQSKTPPNCTMSQHAYAKAIDIAGFKTSDSTYYSVLTDWVIDSGDTCSSSTEPGKDTFLHEVICALKAAKIWNIVLTPNYNAAHRNHFHVDLTAGSDFIKRMIDETGLVHEIPLSALHAD